MGARVIHLADIRARRAELAREGKAFDGTTNFPERFHFWSGASGRRYVHTIYSLLECPAVPAGNYMLVQRGVYGRRRVLEVGRVKEDAASLNLAEIRRRGAHTGANEVHVHLLAGTETQSELIELDLKSAQLLPGAQQAVQSCH
jgi:hypothetical protein